MKKFPEDLKDEFMGFMSANDHDDLPDGAWFHLLEQAAEEFIKKHKLKKFDSKYLAIFYISESITHEIRT